MQAYLASAIEWQCGHVWSRVPTSETSELATVLVGYLYGVIFSFHGFHLGQCDFHWTGHHLLGNAIRKAETGQMQMGETT